MPLQPLSERPPCPVRRPVSQQSWRDLTMLHWPVAPALVAPLLPAGTEPDVLEGVTWVGLVPFVMAGVRVLGTPALPHLSGFAETNVRLYAVDAEGRRGVVFRSLEAARLLPVLVARASYRLPYNWAAMTVRHGAGTVAYTTARRWPAPPGAGATVRMRIGDRYAARPAVAVPHRPLGPVLQLVRRTRRLGAGRARPVAAPPGGAARPLRRPRAAGRAADPAGPAARALVARCRRAHRPAASRVEHCGQPERSGPARVSVTRSRQRCSRSIAAR